MPHKAKPQPEKKKREQGALREPFWQLEEPHFEREYWWPKTPNLLPASEKVLLEHPELRPLRNAKHEGTIRVAPILWEVLRRHPEVRRIRNDLANFLEPLPVHVLWNEEARQVFQDHSYEIEYYLALYGLNAWISRRNYGTNLYSMPSGTLPLDDRARARFELLMHSYVRQRPAPNLDVEFRTEIDLLEQARDHASMGKLVKDAFPAWNNDGNPLSALMQDSIELHNLRWLVDYYTKNGYRISLTAHHPCPITHPAAIPLALDRNEHLFFSVEHFGYLLAFRDRLVNCNDPVSEFLWEKLPPKLQAELLNLDTFLDEDGTGRLGLLIANLCTHLKELLLGPSIYQQWRFSNVMLNEEVRALIQQDPIGDDVIRLNRLLLEAAYPRELAKSSNNDASEVTKTSDGARPNKRRPRLMQLAWIRTVETDIETCDPDIRKDYQRVMKKHLFPLLPRKATDEKREKNDKRLDRVKKDLGKLKRIRGGVQNSKRAEL